MAISAYSEALDICEEGHTTDPADSYSRQNSVILRQQQGLILLLRASAYQQQAQFHKEILQKDILVYDAKPPSSHLLQALLSEALTPSSPWHSFNNSVSQKSIDGNEDMDDTTTGVNNHNLEGATTDSLSEGVGVGVESDGRHGDDESPRLSSPSNDRDNSEDMCRVETRNIDPQAAIRLSVLRMLQANGKLRKDQLRKITFRHGLYHASLLKATSDSLQATDILPDYPTAWVQAGELLCDLWQIEESKQCREIALSLDQSLEESLRPVLEGLEPRLKLVKHACTNMMWPDGNTLQLVLDIAEIYKIRKDSKD